MTSERFDKTSTSSSKHTFKQQTTTRLSQRTTWPLYKKPANRQIRTDVPNIMLFDKEITQKLAPEDRIKVWPDLQSKSEIGIISKKIVDNINKKSHKAQK